MSPSTSDRVLTLREKPSWASTEPDILVNVVDRLAKVRASAPYIWYPVNPTSYAAGYRCVTWGIFANIINGLAHWLENEFGPPGTEFPTLAYLGSNDVRYNGLLLAAIKVGYKMFFTSPRNSPAAHVALFKDSGSRALLTSDTSLPGIIPLAKACNLKLVQVPSLDDLYNKTYPVYSYHKTWSEAKDEPMLVLHSSGTTGHPKLIYWTHACGVSALVNAFNTTSPAGYETFERMIVGKRFFSPLPPFHAAGCGWSLLWPCFLQTQAIIPIQGTIPTIQLIVDGMQVLEADFALIIPTMAPEIQNRPELLDFFADRLEFMFFAGGDVSEVQGDLIANRLPFLAGYGGTDVLTLPLLNKIGRWDPTDWKYMQFHEDAGVDFVKGQYDDEAHEIVLRRKAGKELHQPVFAIFPDADEYRNGDLMIKHPTKDNLWKYTGRSDDIIVFSTGEKHTPIAMEQHIAQHPQVRSALVCGSQRFESALILEPADTTELDSKAQNDLIDSVWPLVEEANKECPKHARVSKSMILVAPHSKPFPRAGKGTIQRRPTVEAFKDELDQLYAQADADGVQENGHADAPIPVADLTEYIRTQVLALTQWPAVKDDDNLFLHGMDSLQSLILTRTLRKSLRLPQLSPALLFQHPMINDYVAALSREVTRRDEADVRPNEPRAAKLSTVLNKHLEVIDQLELSSKQTAAGGEINVLLTGSTGFIGSYILSSLLANSTIKHVFCLNRSADSAQLQSKRAIQRETKSKPDFSRVSFHQCNLSETNFGLPEEAYSTLLAKTTHIIHGAWPVNFSMPLSFFEPSLDAVDRLIQFTAKATNKISLVFLSSIAAVLNLPQQSIPETLQPSHTAPSLDGYGESKYLGDQILAHAATNLGLDVKIMRIGQVAAPAHGAGTWNDREWFPRLIKSSVAVRAVPETLPGLTIDWVPIDTLADILVEITMSAKRETSGDNWSAQVFSPVNSNAIAWQAMSSVITNVIENQSVSEIRQVSPQQWVELVRDDAEKIKGWDKNGESPENDQAVRAMLKRNPAASLLDWFDAIAKATSAKRFENENAVRASPSLQALGPVTPDLMAKWVGDIIRHLDD